MLIFLNEKTFGHLKGQLVVEVVYTLYRGIILYTSIFLIGIHINWHFYIISTCFREDLSKSRLKKSSNLTKLPNIYIEYYIGFRDDKEDNIECKHFSLRSVSSVCISQS